MIGYDEMMNKPYNAGGGMLGSLAPPGAPVGPQGGPGGFGGPQGPYAPTDSTYAMGPGGGMDVMGSLDKINQGVGASIHNQVGRRMV